MAENTRLTGIELNGQLYSLGKTIYEELDMSLERFAELLGRDLYCPTLGAAPTSSSLTYTDTDGSVNTFQLGQPCRWLEGGKYRMAICRNITSTSSEWYILPVNVSELTNDSGYLTQHQDISGKLDATTAASTYLTKTDASNTYLGKTAKAASATKADSATTAASCTGNSATATKATQDADGNVITSTYATKTELGGKQDASLKFTDKAASTWVSDTTYAEFPYRCDIACSGVTADMYAEVAFAMEQAASGNYAPVCETKADVVSVWSKADTSITVPVIVITK